MKILFKFYFTILIGFFLQELPAQMIIKGGFDLRDSTQIHVITLETGQILVGKITHIDTSAFDFKLDNSSLFFPLDLKNVSYLNVANSKKEVEKIVEKQLRKVERKELKNLPQRTHGQENLFLMPTAFNLKKGEKEFRSVNVLWNTIDFGFSDHFSGGIGLFQPANLLLKAKYSFEISSNLRLAVGNISMVNNGLNFGFSHFYAGLTLGHIDKYFSFTGGRTMSIQPFEATTYVFSGGGSFKISNHWRIMSNILLVPDLEFSNNRHVFPSLAMSYLLAKNKIDFGLLFFPSSDLEVIILPGVAYARRF